MIRPNILLISLLLFILWSSCASKKRDFLPEWTEQSIRAHTAFLSDDLLEGRSPGSRGSKLAQKYIISQMERSGLRPGAYDSSYLQHFDMIRMNMGKDINFVLNGRSDRITPDYYKDFMIVPGKHDEVIRVEQSEIVFVGYGIQAPEYNWDDYKDVDVRGKILLMMNNDPDSGDPDFFGATARLYYGRWDYKYEQAARMGAAGAIIIHTTESAGYPWEVVQTGWSGPQFELADLDESSLLCKGWVTEDLAYRIMKMAGQDLDKLRDSAQQPDFRPVNLGVTLDCRLTADYDVIKGANVIGVIPGSDPSLTDQAITITAHYDHLGVGIPVNGDSIYNGALDNASGVATIITLADIFQSLDLSPRRSIVFIATDGEESGLLGAMYYTQHPTFDPSAIAAEINIDGLNLWGKTRDVVLIGYGKSNLDDVVKKYAALQDRKVVPDLTPEQGSFYRSDQFCFAKIGIPGLYMEAGQDYIGKPSYWGKEVQNEWIDKTYHQPNDEYDPSWDLSGHMQDMELLLRVITDVANRDEMPVWNPGDEFENVRNDK